MSNSLLLFSLHSLRRSGDCHNIGSRLSLIWVCTRACVLLGKWAMKFFRKTQTDEGQTCDKLTRDGHLLGELAHSAVTAL